MASALQCPACGHKHRLSALSGDPIFSCEQCGRLLKTPVEYRRPDPAAAPPEPVRPSSRSRVQRGGSAARDDTSVHGTPAPAPVAPAPSPKRKAAKPTAAPAPRPPRARGGSQAALGLPLTILAWVAALVIGGVIVRYLAKFTGLLTGDSVIDLITGSGWGRYLRLFLVVPFWALATAGLMTLFVEGGRRWQEHRRAGPVRPATRPPSAVPAPAPERSMPKAAPSTMPKRRPAPRPEPEPAPAPAPAATDGRASAGAASAPRPRRIPKRDLSSETGRSS